MVAASGDSESDGHAGFGLCSFFPSADAFSWDDEDDGDEGVFCSWSCRPCLCVFLAFNSVVLMAFSALPFSRFFLFFFSRFFCSLPVPYGFHSNEGKERNSLCSLHFISTPSVLFSFFVLLLPLSRSSEGFLVSKKSLLSSPCFASVSFFSSIFSPLGQQRQCI